MFWADEVDLGRWFDGRDEMDFTRESFSTTVGKCRIGKQMVCIWSVAGNLCVFSYQSRLRLDVRNRTPHHEHHRKESPLSP